MDRKHIAFCLEQAYGHITPTIGIALELQRRGHHVSFAVASHFAPLIRKIDAFPVIISPLETRSTALSKILKKDDSLSYGMERSEQILFYKGLIRERTAQSLAQLEVLYADTKPDLIIHDDVLDTAGRELAVKWGLLNILLLSSFYGHDDLDLFAEDEVIIVTVPRFFHPKPALFDRNPRFKLVGFIPEGRKDLFEPFALKGTIKRPILVSGTTGLLQQTDFNKKMIEAFSGQRWDVVQSISGSRDVLSAIDSSELGNASSNIHINTSASNFEILEDASLSIGQGGMGGILEAIYWGVPQILIAPTPFHYGPSKRVADLGLGYCIPHFGMSVSDFREKVAEVLSDATMKQRVTYASQIMQRQHGAIDSADLIEGYLTGRSQ